MPARTSLSRKEDDTRAAGESLALSLRSGDAVLLTGDLGMGKTVFARGIAVGLGVDPGLVRSPSFMLVNLYQGRLPVHHIDLYRVEKLEDMDELGLEEILGGDGVAIVEWAERLGPYRPAEAVEVTIVDRGGSEREIRIDDRRGVTPSGSSGLPS